MSDYNERIAQLETQIAAIRNEKDAEVQRTREAVKPEWRITVTPKMDAYYKIHDESVVLYEIRGECTNREACIEAGHPKSELDDGGLTYLFNKLSGRIIMDTGGGRVYFSDWGHFGVDVEVVKRAHKEAITEISDFIVRNPDGGDITEIHTWFKKATAKK